MLNLKFEDQEMNFYKLNLSATANNIDRFEILTFALIQKVIVAEEQKLLSSFVKSVSGKGKTIKSLLFQDAFE